MVCPCKSTSAWAVVAEVPTNQPAAAIQKLGICCNQSWLALDRPKLMTGSDVSWEYITTQIAEHHSTVRRVNHTAHTRTSYRGKSPTQGFQKGHSPVGGEGSLGPGKYAQIAAHSEGRDPYCTTCCSTEDPLQLGSRAGLSYSLVGVSYGHCSQSAQTEAQGTWRCQDSPGAST